LKTVITEKKSVLAFEDLKVPVRFKLFALWYSSVMLCYVYGDFIHLYQPGKLQAMISGRMPFGAVSQEVPLGMAGVMVAPSLMPFLSVVRPAGVNRLVHIVFGVIYGAMMMLAILGGWHFYVLFGLIEIALTLLIVWYAWTWPRQPTHALSRI
jgi:hypothetical protein